MGNLKKRFASLQNIGPAKIIMLALAGILLIVTSVPWSHQSESKEANISQPKEMIKENGENEEYAAKLENKLKHILEHVDGVGQVEVMITLKSSGEAILNKDVSKEESTEKETGEENSKSTYNMKREEETILADNNGENAPYVIKKLEPEIAGVLISCEGAESNQVASAVVQAAEAVFGISSSHIKVLKMEAHQ